MTTPRLIHHRRDRGFTLIEIVVVMLIFTIVIAMAAVITRGITAGQKRSTTATRLATVDAAILQFVMQQRRLPCPTDGTKLTTDANAGLEGPRTAAGCTGNLQDGVVPWRTLALTEAETTDGWDRRITYRPFPALAGTPGMDMTWCDPAGAAGPVGGPCNPACTSAALGSCTSPTNFMSAKGLRVKDVAGTLIMDPAATPNTGAAYVLISHGESGGGGYLTGSGQLGTSSIGDGTEEAKNYANLPYDAVNSYYVDNSTSDVVGALHFDDIVSRPSIMAVASKAGLGPRAH